MKNNKYLLNTLFALFLFVVLVAAKIYKILVPAVILPDIGIPGITLVSIIPITTDYYITGKIKHPYFTVFVFSALTFGLFPLAAGFISAFTALKLALVGAVIFTITSALFDSLTERILADGKVKAAPVISALGIYLASQCLASVL